MAGRPGRGWRCAPGVGVKWIGWEGGRGPLQQGVVDGLGNSTFVALPRVFF